MNFKEKLVKAYSLAEEYHGEQEYGGMPYTVHLSLVHHVLLRFGVHPNNPAHVTSDEAEDLLVASILHDIVEDTEVSLNDLRKIFGKRVASLVNGVTNEPGVNRRERHSKTYPKTKRIPGAILLKLADRIANIEACLATGDGRINMYLKEREAFYDALRGDSNHTIEKRMWKHLDRLLER
jgi:guanosine-3',5'-bis(diphosphate) 3'-pyrophosphohydrolase